MIVSHSRKFVFSRGFKNAGTSVKAVLSALCDDGDVISSYNPAEVSAVALMGLRGEQNNQRDDGSAIATFESHFGVPEIYDALPSVAGYDVIGVCRCPYDRVYSYAKWMTFAHRYRAGMAPLPIP